MKTILMGALLLATAACSTSPRKESYPNTIEAAVKNEQRRKEHKQRDQYRHPVETLKFFGVEPGMKVVEIWPGAGYYTEILAPYLASKGHYIAAEPTSFYNDKYKKRYEWLEGKVPEKSRSIVKFSPPETVKLAPEGSVDMILTFRNVHNWKKAKKEAFTAFYKALKPGGVLGVVEHRADPKKKKSLGMDSGYVLESEVIKLAKAAGFKIADKSEINANPADTKDYEKGVWTLPPTLKLGDKDRGRYQGIGESDRMTLKFVKPKK